MKGFSKYTVLAATTVAAVAILAMPKAYAGTIAGPFSVSVWTGNGVTDVASLPAPGTAPTATFDYTGPLSFINNNLNGQSNTFNDFFSSDGANPGYLSDISSFSGPSGFFGLTMSTGGFVDNTYMEFTGYYDAPAIGGTISILHDDGASFYANGVPLILSPLPTSAITNTSAVAGGTNVPFDLVYVEANGAPADLVVTGNLTAVPEPNSLVLMGTGGVLLLGAYGLAAVKMGGNV